MRFVSKRRMGTVAASPSFPVQAIAPSINIVEDINVVTVEQPELPVALTTTAEVAGGVVQLLSSTQSCLSVPFDGTLMWEMSTSGVCVIGAISGDPALGWNAPGNSFAGFLSDGSCMLGNISGLAPALTETGKRYACTFSNNQLVISINGHEAGRMSIGGNPTHLIIAGAGVGTIAPHLYVDQLV